MTPNRTYEFLDEDGDYTDYPYFSLHDKDLVGFETAYPNIITNDPEPGDKLILHWILKSGGWHATLPETKTSLPIYLTLYYTFPTGHDFAAAAEKTIEYLKRRRSRT